MRALVTANLTRNGVFASIPGNEMVGGEVDLWTGRIYGSENAPDERIVDGAPRDALREQLRASYERLRIIVDHRILLDDIARSWEKNDAEWAKQILEPILARTPRHALARYWFGTAVHLARQELDEAERIFHDLLEHGMVEPTWEMWLRSWIHNRLGVIASARKRNDDALAHFQEAYVLATAAPEREFARDQLKRLRAHE